MKLFNLLATLLTVFLVKPVLAFPMGSWRIDLKDWVVAFKGTMNGLNRGFYKDEDF